ncbi:MAG TPA: CehA/McbA family metallohydrolase [Candidatus Limnocylindria bacterium]|nr:CehA/McbA family metallohydrolase [Candidatus Limnocylindria bacterium]
MDATLRLRAVDAEGPPVPARFYVTDASGQSVYPDGSVYVGMRNERLWASERHFIADAPTDLRLRPGRVSVLVERGPEFLPQAVEVELQPGERRRIEIVVPRWIDMNARGWFSGDIHVHRRPGEMRQLLVAEELNLGTCIITQWRDDPHDSTQAPSGTDGWLSVIDANHAFSQNDAEVERLGEGPGALVAVGLRTPLTFDCDRWYPPDATFADLAHAAGGHVDAEKPVWATVPVLAALGKLDSVGVVCNHFARTGADLDLGPWGARLPPEGRIRTSEGLARWMGELYSRLLNCGFRLPVTGGSASGIIPNPVGYTRTYVRLAEEFSYPAWLAALRRGRSFATNGPMLNVTADGRQVGDEIDVRSGRTLQVRAEADCPPAMCRLELLLNGEVVADARRAEGASTVVLEHDLTVREPGWLAARAFAGAEPNIRFGQTSPIYLSGPGRPSRCAADAALLGEWVDELVGRATDATADWPRDRRSPALAPLREAAAVYRGLSEP